MRITIHFPFKPSITITKCDGITGAYKNGYNKDSILIKATKESEWDLLLGEQPFDLKDDAKNTILRLYNDNACSIIETEDGYYTVRGMASFEVSEKEYDD